MEAACDLGDRLGARRCSPGWGGSSEGCLIRASMLQALSGVPMYMPAATGDWAGVAWEPSLMG